MRKRKFTGVGIAFAGALLLRSTLPGEPSRADLKSLYTVIELATLSDDGVTSGNGMNASGQVVGTSGTSSGPHAFLWTSSDGMQDLGTLPSDTRSEALAINNSGQVAGQSSGPSGTHAFTWTRAGGMEDLGTLPGGGDTRALGLNNSGWVVGTCDTTSGRRAFLWKPNVGMQDLNSLIPPLDELGSVVSEAHSIGELGQIIAIIGGGPAAPMAGDDTHEHDHFYRAFILTP